MADRFTIRIGGDASGPVVAGHGNTVETHQPAPESTQTNTANEHATVFTVMHGDMHVHRDAETGESAD
jgi:hypothetical protein